MSEHSRPSVPWDAFEGGTVRERELRLSQGELDSLRRACPGAEVVPLDGNAGGQKSWYIVRLEGESVAHG